MKKILCLVLCLMFAVSVFSGCGNTKVNNDEILADTQIDNDVDKETAENDVSKPENDKKEENEEIKKEEDKKPVTEEKPPVKLEKSVSQIIKEMISVIPEGQHNLEEIPVDLYKDIYGIDKSQFNDVIIYGTMISVKANEIILIKVNNESEIQKAVDLLNQRKDQVYKTWEQYLPDQFEMVKNGVIKTNGKYAALIISPEVNSVANKFTELTK